MNMMIAITISPGAVTAVARLIAPWLLAFTTAPPAPTSTRKKVPSSSENRRRHSSFGSSNWSTPGYSSESRDRYPGLDRPPDSPSCLSVAIEVLLVGQEGED